MNIRLIREIIRLRRRQLIFIAVLFMLGGVLYLVRTAYLQTRLVEARQEWAANRSQQNQRVQLGRAEQYDAAQRDFTRFAARIPVKRDFARVIGELFEFADNNSLSVGSVTYKPEPKKQEYLEYKISIDVTGKYGAIKSFLADIHGAPEIIAVESISLSKGGKYFEEEVTMRATLSILFKQEG